MISQMKNDKKKMMILQYQLRKIVFLKIKKIINHSIRQKK
jgi:hypothetical protein